MGWNKKPQPHPCDPPERVEPGEDIQFGDEWICDECQAVWKVNGIEKSGKRKGEIWWVWPIRSEESQNWIKR